MNYFKRKRLAVLFFIGLILVSQDPVLSNAQATSASNQKDNKSPEEPLIVNENMVAFIVLSQKDYDLLVSKEPELEAELPDILDDFYSHSGKISKILDKMGITVKYGTSQPIWFQYPDGQIEKMPFNPEDIYGMALFAKGKAPKLVVEFGPHFEAMAKILSEYFQIKIEWRMTSEFINSNEQIIDWDKVKTAFEAYVKEPSSENAKAFLCTLPKDKPEKEKGDKGKAGYYIYFNYSLWERKVLAGDRYITEAVFRLVSFADGAFAEAIWEVLSTLAQINPRLFLEILYEYRNVWYVKHIGYPGIGTKYDVPRGPISELEMRIKALESVKDPKYSELRDECIRLLRKAIRKSP